MKIGIAGPVSTESVTKCLDGDVSSLPQGYGGAPFLGTIIATLLERGHEVSAYTLDRELPPSLKHPIIAVGRKFKIYYSPWRQHSFRPNGWRLGYMLDFFAAERRALMHAIALDQPDVVHAHWAYEFAFAAIASNRPYLVTSHDAPIQVLRYIPNAYRLGRYFMARIVFRKALAMTAVSPYLQSEIAKYAKVPVVVIPNPLPLSLLQGNITNIPDGLALSKPRIAMILSGWQTRKNPVPALRAFVLLRQKFPDATLHLFGDDFGKDEIAQRWVASHNLGRGFVFRGLLPHDDLLRELGTMHLLLHPALEETFGATLAEAMALGIPVVAGSESGAVPWVLDNGAAGVLTDVSSPECIFKAIIRIMQDPEVYIKYAKAGKNRALEAFSPGTVVDQYEAQYRQAIDNQPAHRRLSSFGGYS
jgi:glycosyltransferase involved in cell wall biosynthesis